MGKENTKGMGITDMPCTSEEEDLLEISKYVKGLGKFIRECQTPMSIAIQGDWGTGKTSTLNLLKKNLEADKDTNGIKCVFFLEADKDTNGIKCVFFNTWQYSQFNMEDSLYVSFVHNLVKQCGGNDEILKTVAGFGKLAFFKAIDWKFGTNASEILDGFEKAKKDQMESVSKLQEDFAELGFGKLAFFKAIDWKFGTNASEILDGFEKAKKDQMESVSKLQEDFAELVKKTGKRLVIFIDDLDRLNPEVAVELLEIIKLFVNVENSIFVLAIDYEVVVKGVRKKYGESLSEEKCRNFFDKIIQLPFKMPVERYNLTELVRKAVQEQTHMTDEGVNLSEEKCRNFFDKIIQLPFKMPVERYNLTELVRKAVQEQTHMTDEGVNIVAEFISDVMGTNPRTFKRLVNAFFLINSVNEIGEEAESKTKEINDVLMFCSLCIQMCLPKLYELMVTASTKKQLKELLEVKAAEEIRAYVTNVLMFCSLCIQMCLPKLYELMVTASTKKQLKELLEVKAAEEIRAYVTNYLIDMEGTDKEFNEIIKGIRLFHEEVLNAVSEKFKEEVVLETLFGLLAVTSITMVSADSAANSGRKAATKITHIRINEKEIAVASANAAIVETFRALLGKNMSYMEEFMLQNPAFQEFMLQNPAFLTNEETKKDSMFRQHKLLLRDGDTAIYLGVSSGTEAKIKQVAKLCQFLKDKGQINQVKWLNGEDELQINQVKWLNGEDELFCFLPEIENN